MNRNTTIALVVIFAALLVYVLVVQRPADEAAQNATPTAGAVTSGPLWGTLTGDQVLSVRVEDRAQGRSVAFGRAEAAASWGVTEPESKSADQLAAASNVATLATLTYQSQFTPGAGLEAFGVLSPTYVIEIKLVDGRLLRAFVGDKTPTGDSYYVQQEGQAQVSVVSGVSLSAIFSWLDQPPYLQPTATPTPDVTVTPVEPTLTPVP